MSTHTAYDTLDAIEAICGQIESIDEPHGFTTGFPVNAAQWVYDCLTEAFGCQATVSEGQLCHELNKISDGIVYETLGTWDVPDRETAEEIFLLNSYDIAAMYAEVGDYAHCPTDSVDNYVSQAVEDFMEVHIFGGMSDIFEGILRYPRQYLVPLGD